MHKKERIVLAIAIATVFLVAAVGSASANGMCVVNETLAYGCNDTVEYSCTFNETLNCAGNGTSALTIGADNIVIDGAGYELAGNNYNWFVGIKNLNHSGVVVKNLSISDFLGYGMWFSGKPDPLNSKKIKNIIENCAIENCTVHEIGTATQAGAQGIFLKGMSNSAIKSNEVYGVKAFNEDSCGSGGNGIYFFGGIKAGNAASQHNNITCNWLHDNQKAGFFAKCWPQHNNISYNNVSGNSWAGILDVPGGIVLRCKKANSNIVIHNDLSNNYGDGLYVGSCHNTIKYNTVTSNTGTGINMGRGDGSDYNEISWNIVCNNTAVDIVTCGDGVPPDIGHSCWFNFGINNTCDNCMNCQENNSIYCNFSCGEQADLVIEDIRPVRWCCCYIEPIQAQKGGDDSEKMQVMFIDDPELAKEFGDEELRKEVAEALAKDPKLAEEIAVKLAGDDKERAKELSRDPKQLALCCCRCNAIKELADLLDTELTGQAQHEMSDVLDEIVGCGCCCGGCCLTADCKCCCCGRFIAYKIANVGDAEAGWSLSNLTVNGRVRSVDIVRPLDAQTSRWEVFPCYRMWWWPSWPREVTVCADVTDWVVESDETNNCRTEWWPGIVRAIPIDK